MACTVGWRVDAEFGSDSGEHLLIAPFCDTGKFGLPLHGHRRRLVREALPGHRLKQLWIPRLWDDGWSGFK